MAVKKKLAGKSGRRIIIEDVDNDGGGGDAAPAADSPGSTVLADYPGSSWFDDIATFVSDPSRADSDYIAVLFKKDDAEIRAGAEKWEICDETKNEYYSVKQIGLQFGGGAFRYFVKYPSIGKECVFSRRFNLHAVWNERKKAGEIAAAAPAVSRSSGMDGAIGLIKSVVDILRPMIPAPVAPVDTGMALMRNYEMMQSVLKKNLESNVELYRNMTEGAGDMDNSQAGGGGAGGGEDGGVLGVILPLLDRYLPVILGKGKTAEITIETIKALPIFKKLLKDRQALKAVIAGIEKKIGIEETTKLLKSLGLAGRS